MKTFGANYQEQKKKQLTFWKEMILKIFRHKPSESLMITDKDDIVNILDAIGKAEALNHTFLPSGGGLDLSGAVFSNEAERIELNFDGAPMIVNPESLSFHPVSDNPEWWYFRLNTLPFEPSGVYPASKEEGEDIDEGATQSASAKEIAWGMSFVGEEVLEVKPGWYVERAFWDMNHLGHDENGNLKLVPRSSRLISRKINGGAFVIFPKLSAYNRNSATYDGRHNKVDDITFHEYIKQVVEKLSARN